MCWSGCLIWLGQAAKDYDVPSDSRSHTKRSSNMLVVTEQKLVLVRISAFVVRPHCRHKACERHLSSDMRDRTRIELRGWMQDIGCVFSRSDEVLTRKYIKHRPIIKATCSLITWLSGPSLSPLRQFSTAYD